MKISLVILVSFAYFCTISAKIYFEETFSDDSWESNWVYSQFPDKDFGKFVRTAGKFYNDPEADKGIQTSQDAKFYAISNKFPPFSNENKDLVIQFSVKHEQAIDCGGGYLKIFNCKLDQEDMHGESPYEIMFGPDICGPGMKKVHVIFSYKEKNLLINKDIHCKDDVNTHMYTLIVRPDNTYEVQIDGEKVESGSLESDWDFLAPKTIKDPNAKKPEDWDDKPTIPDPNDKKPEDWDKPEHIPDPEATKPDDWDDDMDGEWEPPQIDNPEYKGEWSPKQIDNPAYKGLWVHPEIPNPEYSPDDTLYLRKEICIVGFDLWQVKAGSIFDNILITDDVNYAKQIADNVKKTQEGETSMKAESDEEKNKQDAENIKPIEEGDDDDDNDDDDDDDDVSEDDFAEVGSEQESKRDEL